MKRFVRPQKSAIYQWYSTLEGYKQASLAVQKMNYAVRMYRKVGFEIVDENDEEYIMICNL